MSFAKLLGPAIVAVSGLFATSATVAEDCNLDDSAKNVVNFLVQTTPDNWNTKKLSSYGGDALEDMKDIISTRYKGHVEKIFDDLRKAVENDKDINWNRVYHNSSYVFYNVLDDLKRGRLSASVLNDAEDKAEDLMDEYIGQADEALDAAIKLAGTDQECLIDPDAPRPSM